MTAVEGEGELSEGHLAKKRKKRKNTSQEELPLRPRALIQ